MATWLVQSALLRAVLVLVPARDIVLCSWAGHTLLSQCPRVLGLPCNGLASHPGGVEILLVVSCTETRIDSGLMCHVALMQTFNTLFLQ